MADGVLKPIPMTLSRRPPPNADELALQINDPAEGNHFPLRSARFTLGPNEIRRGFSNGMIASGPIQRLPREQCGGTPRQSRQQAAAAGDHAERQAEGCVAASRLIRPNQGLLELLALGLEDIENGGTKAAR